MFLSSIYSPRNANMVSIVQIRTSPVGHKWLLRIATSFLLLRPLWLLFKSLLLFFLLWTTHKIDWPSSPLMNGQVLPSHVEELDKHSNSLFSPTVAFSSQFMFCGAVKCIELPLDHVNVGLLQVLPSLPGLLHIPSVMFTSWFPYILLTPFYP